MQQYLKAVAAGITSLAAWGYAVVDSPPENISAGEWVGLTGVALVVLAVFVTPNKTPEAVAPVAVAPAPTAAKRTRKKAAPKPAAEETTYFDRGT